MILWDYEFRDAAATTRLASLPDRKLLSFATATLEHVTEGQIATVDAATAGLVSRALMVAWQRVAGHAPVGLDAIAADLHANMFDEDAPGEPGVADAIDGAARLCSCSTQPSPQAALTVASYAYQALTCWVLDPESTMGAEERFVEAERASPACRAEIAFQLGYLEALERLAEGDIPTRDRVERLIIFDPGAA